MTEYSSLCTICADSCVRRVCLCERSIFYQTSLYIKGHDDPPRSSFSIALKRDRDRR